MRVVSSIRFTYTIEVELPWIESSFENLRKLNLHLLWYHPGLEQSMTMTTTATAICYLQGTRLAINIEIDPNRQIIRKVTDVDSIKRYSSSMVNVVNWVEESRHSNFNGGVKVKWNVNIISFVSCGSWLAHYLSQIWRRAMLLVYEG